MIFVVWLYLLLPGVSQLDSPPPPHGSNQELRHATYPGSALVENDEGGSALVEEEEGGHFRKLVKITRCL